MGRRVSSCLLCRVRRRGGRSCLLVTSRIRFKIRHAWLYSWCAQSLSWYPLPRVFWPGKWREADWQRMGLENAWIYYKMHLFMWRWSQRWNTAEAPVYEKILLWTVLLLKRVGHVKALLLGTSAIRTPILVWLRPSQKYSHFKLLAFLTLLPSK